MSTGPRAAYDRDMFAGGSFFAAVFVLLIVLLSAWALFWVIRLAVRYGVSDALRESRDRATERSDAARR